MKSRTGPCEENNMSPIIIMWMKNGVVRDYCKGTRVSVSFPRVGCTHGSTPASSAGPSEFSKLIWMEAAKQKEDDAVAHWSVAERGG